MKNTIEADRAQQGPSSNRYLTFYESGTRLLVADGLWRCPRDAARGPLAAAWVDVPEDIKPAVPSLRAGEYIEMATQAYPSLLPIVQRALEAARSYARRS